MWVGADPPSWGPMRLLILVCLSLSLVAAVPDWVTDLRGEVMVDLAAGALPLRHEICAISVVSTYDPAAGRMTGTLRAAIVNDGTDAWPSVGFALHANNTASYQGTSIAIDAAMVGGVAVTADLVDDGRGVILPLAEPLAPGAWVECSLTFTTVVPVGGGRAGLLARDESAHSLYSWLPEPAVRSADGWTFAAITTMSDPCWVRCADYRWDLSLPEGWTLVASGHEAETAPGSWRVLAPRTRNLVAWVSDQEAQTLALTGQGPLVRVTHLGRYTIQAAFCAAVARDALVVASEAFGAYPRRSYDIVFTDFTEAVGGMEASGMTFISGESFRSLDRRARDPFFDGQNATLHSIIHEVCHSWWYDAVGNDTGVDPWIDEPLTEWSTWFVLERLRGREAFIRAATQRAVALPVVASNMVPLTTPGWDLSEMQFGILLYCRGPLLYEALRLTVGEEVLLQALRTWYTEHSGSEVTRQDWEATFLTLLPEEQRAAFVATWLDGTEEPVPAILDQILPKEILKIIRPVQPGAAAAPAEVAP